MTGESSQIAEYCAKYGFLASPECWKWNKKICRSGLSFSSVLSSLLFYFVLAQDYDNPPRPQPEIDI
jgi:hypothetical protein